MAPIASRVLSKILLDNITQNLTESLSLTQNESVVYKKIDYENGQNYEQAESQDAKMSNLNQAFQHSNEFTTDDYKDIVVITGGNLLNCANCLISPETSMIFDDIVFFLTDRMSPAVAITNFFLNLICILIFSNKIFKGSLYKFFLFNSIFDSILLFLVAIKPIVKMSLLEKQFELYVYIYISSVCLTCSNLCKITFSLDRLSKMTGQWRPFLKKTEHISIFFMIFFSVGFNGPMLFGYDILEYLWFKQTYYELVMNRIGHETFRGNIMILNSIILDTGIYVCVVVINLKLGKAIKRNIENLRFLIENEKRKHTVIKLLDEKEEVYDYDEDDVVNNEATDNSVDGLLFRGRNLEEQNEKNSNEKKKDPSEVEAARQKLCSLVLVNNMIYFVGHGLFSLSALCQHLVNFYFGPLDVKIGYNYYAYLDLFNACANLLLFWSLGMNFFAYFFYNQRFSSLVRSKKKCFCSSNNKRKTIRKSEILRR